MSMLARDLSAGLGLRARFDRSTNRGCNRRVPFRVTLHRLRVLATCTSVFVFVASASSAQVKIFTVDSVALEPDALVGDGICETASGDCTWQAARSEMSVILGGGSAEYEIRFAPGLESVYSGVFSVDPFDDITLTIKGPIIVEADQDPEGFQVGTGLFFSFVDHITVQDVWIRGPGTSDTENPWSDNSLNGIKISGGGTSCTIRENRFTGVREVIDLGINAAAVACTFTLNRVGLALDGTGETVAPNGGPVTFEGENNVISNNQITGSAGAGLFVNKPNNMILNNDVYGNGAVGIQVSADFTKLRGNAVGNNASHGLNVSGDFNEILDTYAGTDATGFESEPNGGDGLRVSGDGNCIGAPLGLLDECDPTLAEPSELSIFSANQGVGVYIRGESNLLTNAYVGLDGDGDPLGNQGDGVELRRSFSAVLGNIVDGVAIGSNGGHGVRMERTAFHTVRGSVIGVHPVSLDAPRGNSGAGVYIDQSEDVVVGGATSFADGGDGNLIGSNTIAGVQVDSSNDGVTIAGNTIGIGAGGTTRLPNGVVGGVYVSGGFNSDVVVSDNTISGEPVGVYLVGGGASVVSNQIGTNEDGEHGLVPGELGNWIGIALAPGSGSTIGGGAGLGNTISDNRGSGILAIGTKGADISWNDVGRAASPMGLLQRIGNADGGIELTAGTTDVEVIENEITLSGGPGVRVDGPASFANRISRNSIYSNGGKGIALTNDGNGALPPPDTTANDLSLISGSVPSCPGCTIEVFSDAEDEGSSFENATITAGDGSFTVPGFFAGPNVTCTITTTLFDTSEFGCGIDDNPPEAPEYFDGVQFTKRDLPSPGGAVPGGTLRYEIILANAGALGFVDDPDVDEIVDRLPPEVEFLSESLEVDGLPNDDDPSDGVGYDATEHAVVWNGPLAIAGGVAIRFDVTLSASLEIDDTLENQARLMVEVDAVTERLASLRSDDPDTALSEDPTITVVPESGPVAAALAALGSVAVVARRNRARA